MLPALWRIMEGTNYSQFYENFKIAAGLTQGRHRGAPFNDGDFYKLLEASSATLASARDPKFLAKLDGTIAVLAKAQRPDGYIHTPVLIASSSGETQQEFTEPLQFETYNMGHLLSAACVHFRATRQTNFLVVARKTADFLCERFAHPSPALARFSVCPSHYVGMIDMYRTTGEKRYVEGAKHLIRARNLIENGDDDNQTRVAFEEQTNAMGHAVRANYLYAGVADLFLETGDGALWAPLQQIWTNVVERKMYITGGCGALFDGASPDGSKDEKHITRVHQAYGRDYELPNLTAHNETCANIANVLWNWRMFLATGEARFMDVVELALYNSVLSGTSLDGTNFFYVNPLRSIRPMPVDLRWKHERVPFLSSFCCPPNLARTLAEVGGYAYAKSKGSLWLNLYGSNSLTTEIDDLGKVEIEQDTDYPWAGKVNLTILACPKAEFALNLRVPGWVRQAGDKWGSLKVNGRKVEVSPGTSGYLTLARVWQKGDTIQLSLLMKPRIMSANPLVEETLGQVAIMRGPLVYCLELPEKSSPAAPGILDITLPTNARMREHFEPSFLGGIEVIQISGFVANGGQWGNALYRPISPGHEHEVKFQFIPYFAWANRGPSEMTVWVPLTPESKGQ